MSNMSDDLRGEIIQALKHFIDLYQWKLLDLNHETDLAQFVKDVENQYHLDLRNHSERKVRQVVARIYAAMQYDAIISEDKKRKDCAYTEIHKLMYRIARIRWKDDLQGIADDIAQTAILLVYKKPTPRLGRDAFWGYLNFAIYWEAQTIELRKRKDSDEISDDIADSTGEDPLDLIWQKQARSWLREQVRKWRSAKPAWYELIMLDLDPCEYSDEEMSSLLQSNANAIRQRRSKYHKALKEAWEKNTEQSV